jgi:hypothetical protein
MRIYYKIALGVMIVSALGITSTLANRPALSEAQALTMIYGNYNPAMKHANWINIPFPNKKIDGYFEERKGFVKAISLANFQEKGKNKVFFLTKTIPTNIPFDCHACLPLIGATVFAEMNNHWKIEAQNQFIMYDGEYGELPIVKLIQVGQDKFGLSLEFEHGVVREKEISILIPYKKRIIQAHKEVIYYENFNDCEFSKTIPCEAYTADISFNKPNERDYYNLKVKKFGTTFSEKRNKSMPIDQTITYKFLNGKYKEITRMGSNYIEAKEY